MIASGGLVILGVQSAAVPGDSIKAKRQSLYESNADQLLQLVESRGFIAEVLADHLVLIPSGFVVMMLCPSEEATGVRWQTSADEADRLRVCSQLTEMLSDFPETKSSATGYTQLLDFLKSTILSSRSCYLGLRLPRHPFEMVDVYDRFFPMQWAAWSILFGWSGASLSRHSLAMCR